MSVYRVNISRDRAQVVNLPKANFESPFLRNLPRVAIAGMTKGYIRQGERSLAVSMIQASLAYLGAKSGPMQNRSLAADGVFGARTYLAVRRFQSDWRLGVDGTVGPETLIMIDTLTMR